MGGRERSLQVLSTALKMEEKGRRYYQQAAAESRNELARRIFQTLADEEEAHVEHLRRLWVELDGGARWTDRSLRDEVDEGLLQATTEDIRSFFSLVAHQHAATFQPEGDDLTALELSIQFEDQAVSFYQNQLDLAEDPMERRFLKAMIEEEREHHGALVELRGFLSDTGAWLGEEASVDRAEQIGPEDGSEGESE